jgi:hypothetical protein
VATSRAFLYCFETEPCEVKRGGKRYFRVRLDEKYGNMNANRIRDRQKRLQEQGAASGSRNRVTRKESETSLAREKKREENKTKQWR